MELTKKKRVAQFEFYANMQPSISPTLRAIHQALVLEKREVAPAHYQLKLGATELADQVRPGQFVHILTTPNLTGWRFDPLLRRAFSIMSVDKAAKCTVDILFRVEGRGTQILAMASVGDEIDLIGPLGKEFDVSAFVQSSSSTGEFHVKHPSQSAIVVGGGVGVPPLVYLSQFLSDNGTAVHAIIGARRKAEIICESELSRACEEINTTTDDGSRGHKGRVTDLLPDLIEKLITSDGAKPIVYSCGPLPMLRAVAGICARSGTRCQVSLEENMPCGIGICNGCVVRARQPFADEKPQTERDLNEIVGDEWSPYRAYRRVCVEGPACWSDEIDWEHGHD